MQILMWHIDVLRPGQAKCTPYLKTFCVHLSEHLVPQSIQQNLLSHQVATAQNVLQC